MQHRVIAHSGCSYSNVPLEFFIGEEHHAVSQVIANRLEESEGMEGMTRHVWVVEDELGARYRLTYFTISDFWEIEPE